MADELTRFQKFSTGAQVAGQVMNLFGVVLEEVFDKMKDGTFSEDDAAGLAMRLSDEADDLKIRIRRRNGNYDDILSDKAQVALFEALGRVAHNAIDGSDVVDGSDVEGG